jgi:hypothetical protein
MPSFAVHIGEMTPSFEVESHEPALEVRDVYWLGEAADPDAARGAGSVAWDVKYGPGKQPISANIAVTALDECDGSFGKVIYERFAPLPEGSSR